MKMLAHPTLLTVAALCMLIICALTADTSGQTAVDSCIAGDCHAELLTAKRLHFPVGKGVCKICHRPVDAATHTFKIAREGGDLCRYCHWDLETEKNAHAAFGERECVICHNPHGSQHEYLLPTDRSAEMCDGCHGDLIRNRSVLHTPVATGPCTVCHDPHDSEPEPTAEENSALCFQCHESTGEQLSTLEHVHEPLQTGSCDDCHDPHGSDIAMNLRDDVPALCYGCHPEIQQMVETSTHQHSVAGEPGGCLKCHTPHASSVSYGLREDPLTLCRSCHEEDLIGSDGQTVSGFAHQIEGKLFLHGPVRQRDCGACHNSHGSNNYRLLVGEYSPEFYAGFNLGNFQLCFSCHPQRGVLTEETTNLTDFRNGDLNLHFLHVNKPDKGRTCRACHATHASDRPKHIRDWILFGQWELPITFEKTDTGGSCESGCHIPRDYDRENPVDYGDAVPTPPGSSGGSAPDIDSHPNGGLPGEVQQWEDRP